MRESRILVVEDDRATRHALASLFKEGGLGVTEAATLEEALNQLQECFDVICLDLLLPDGNGLEVLREVRDHRLPTRVAVISGANEMSMLSEVTSLKPDAIFGKPLEIKDFFDWLVAQGLAAPKKQ